MQTWWYYIRTFLQITLKIETVTKTCLCCVSPNSFLGNFIFICILLCITCHHYAYSQTSWVRIGLHNWKHGASCLLDWTVWSLIKGVLFSACLRQWSLCIISMDIALFKMLRSEFHQVLLIYLQQRILELLNLLTQKTMTNLFSKSLLTLLMVVLTTVLNALEMFK